MKICRFCCPSDIAANPFLVSEDNLAVISVFSNKGMQKFNLQYRYGIFLWLNDKSFF